MHESPIGPGDRKSSSTIPPEDHPDPLGWPDITLRWSRRRGWPTQSGLSVLAVPGLLIILSLVALAADGPARLPGILIGDGVLSIGALLLVLVVPGLHHTETSISTFIVTPAAISLTEDRGYGRSETREICRQDAGALHLLMVGRGPRRAIASAWGISADGGTTISLANESVSTAGRFVSHSRRIPVAHLLISWWPANDQSAAAFGAFENLGQSYWQPA
jgi:hypothetical protein